MRKCFCNRRKLHAPHLIENRRLVRNKLRKFKTGTGNYFCRVTWPVAVLRSWSLCWKKKLTFSKLSAWSMRISLSGCLSIEVMCYRKRAIRGAQLLSVEEFIKIERKCKEKTIIWNVQVRHSPFTWTAQIYTKYVIIYMCTM